MVGSEEEYNNGTNSDLFFIIKESHSNWKNIKAEDLILEDARAILTVTGDRTAEGIEYTDEEVRFKFINEEGSWKIDAYYPLDILIIPVSPEPDNVINSAGITTLTISASIRFFFPINDMSLKVNDSEVNPNTSREDKYEPEISVGFPMNSLIPGLNKVNCSVASTVGQYSDYNWNFIVK